MGIEVEYIDLVNRKFPPLEEIGILWTMPHSGTRTIKMLFQLLEAPLYHRHLYGLDNTKYVDQLMMRLGTDRIERPIVTTMRDPRKIWMTHYQRGMQPGSRTDEMMNNDVQKYFDHYDWLLRSYQDTLVFYIDQPHSIEFWRTLKAAFPSAKWDKDEVLKFLYEWPKVGSTAANYLRPLVDPPEYVVDFARKHGYV